jgi:hypothetical protein
MCLQITFMLNPSKTKIIHLFIAIAKYDVTDDGKKIDTRRKEKEKKTAWEDLLFFFSSYTSIKSSLTTVSIREYSYFSPPFQSKNIETNTFVFKFLEISRSKFSKKNNIIFCTCIYFSWMSCHASRLINMCILLLRTRLFFVCLY